MIITVKSLIMIDLFFTCFIGSELLASGGNDNQLLVWDRRRDQTGPLLELNQHVAAVKAIDWSPHQPGLLASGGGTADRTIRFWNTKLPISANIGGNDNNYASLKPIQASSQVCTLAWSPLSPGEILSTHGFSEHNLALWSYPNGNCLGTLDGHSQRVLFQAMGPDGSTVVTGSGDETLRFWSVFRRPAASDQLQNRTRNGRNTFDRTLENIFQSSR
jgi:cell division cycle 20-like protein 1, cofactor of APC complex